MELKTYWLIGQELNSIGNTYLDMGDPRTGLNYYRQSLAVFQKTNLNNWVAVGYWKMNEPSKIG